MFALKNCVITGGAGFIASHLAEKIGERFDRVYLLDNLSRTNNLRNIQHLLTNPKFEFIHGDVSCFDLETLKDVSHLFHLAGPRINRMIKYKREGHVYIADGGFNVVDFCARNRIKMFFASTASVYASPKRFPISEDDPVVPNTLYGASKYYTENVIRSYDRMMDFNYTINRFFNVYGPRMDNTGAYTEILFNWLNNIKTKKNEVTIFGDPKTKTLDLIYVADIVNAIVKSTFESNKETFNVSTEVGTTLEELANTIKKVTNTDLMVKVLPETRLDIENKRIGDATKLRGLGWKSQYSLEEGVRKTFEWVMKE